MQEEREWKLSARGAQSILHLRAHNGTQTSNRAKLHHTHPFVHANIVEAAAHTNTPQKFDQVIARGTVRGKVKCNCKHPATGREVGVEGGIRSSALHTACPALARCSAFVRRKHCSLCLSSKTVSAEEEMQRNWSGTLESVPLTPDPLHHRG
jgi:hypothetical protein